MYEDSTSEGDIFIIQFTNGGKILKPGLDVTTQPIFVVMVIRFLGSRIKEYKLAQYTSIPEMNWLSGYEDIIKVCRNKGGSQSPGPRFSLF